MALYNQTPRTGLGPVRGNRGAESMPILASVGTDSVSLEKRKSLLSRRSFNKMILAGTCAMAVGPKLITPARAQQEEATVNLILQAAANLSTDPIEIDWYAMASAGLAIRAIERQYGLD